MFLVVMTFEDEISRHHTTSVLSSSILIWPDLISSLLSASVQFSSYLNTLLLFSPNLISSLIFCFVLISFKFFLFLFTYFIFSPSVSSLSHTLCLSLPQCSFLIYYWKAIKIAYVLILFATFWIEFWLFITLTYYTCEKTTFYCLFFFFYIDAFSILSYPILSSFSFSLLLYLFIFIFYFTLVE